MEPAFDEENRGEGMETDRGGAGGEGEAGVPYVAESGRIGEFEAVSGFEKTAF